MTSSIPAAITNLLAKATQAISGVTGAIVADGWTDQIAPVMFGIGSPMPPFFEGEQTPIEGQPEWAGLGNIYLQEDFVVPCYIYAGAGGVDTSDIRATAFAIWDVFLPLLKADTSLGGALQMGRDAALGTFTVSGPRSAEEAQGGRYCLIRFDVHCQNLY